MLSLDNFSNLSLFWAAPKKEINVLFSLSNKVSSTLDKDGALIFAIFKFIIKNNYAMIPFYTLFIRFYDRFAATDFGAVSSYPNELLFMGLSLILASFVLVSLTKKLFNITVKW